MWHQCGTAVESQGTTPTVPSNSHPRPLRTKKLLAEPKGVVSVNSAMTLEQKPHPGEDPVAEGLAKLRDLLRHLAT